MAEVDTCTGDTINITGGTAVVAGSYPIASRTSDNEIVLTGDITSDASSPTNVTADATIGVDMDLFINTNITLTKNATLGNPTNEKVGQSGYIRIIQDAGGANTLSYGTDWEFAGGSAPTLSTGASDEDVLHYVVLAANRVLATLTADID